MSKTRRGSALIEFALGATVLVGLLTAGVQYGVAFLSYGELQTAVMAGARFASTAPQDSSYAATVRNLVVYGQPQAPPAARPVVRGLKPEHVRVAATADAVTVDIDGYTIDAGFHHFPLRGKPAVTLPYLAGAH
jgi:hypothetical protein